MSTFNYGLPILLPIDMYIIMLICYSQLMVKIKQYWNKSIIPSEYC